MIKSRRLTRLALKSTLSNRSLRRFSYEEGETTLRSSSPSITSKFVTPSSPSSRGSATTLSPSSSPEATSIDHHNIPPNEHNNIPLNEHNNIFLNEHIFLNEQFQPESSGAKKFPPHCLSFPSFIPSSIATFIPTTSSSSHHSYTSSSSSMGISKPFHPWMNQSSHVFSMSNFSNATNSSPISTSSSPEWRMERARYESVLKSRLLS